MTQSDRRDLRTIDGVHELREANGGKRRLLIPVSGSHLTQKLGDCIAATLGSYHDAGVEDQSQAISPILADSTAHGVLRLLPRHRARSPRRWSQWNPEPRHWQSFPTAGVPV